MAGHVCAYEKRQYELTLSATDPVNRRDEKDGKVKRNSENQQRTLLRFDNFFSMLEKRWRFT